MKRLLVLTFLLIILAEAVPGQIAVLYDFEQDTDHWTAATTETVKSITQSNLYANSGTGSLQITIDLDPSPTGHEAEIWVMHPSDLAEQTVSASVLFPTECPGIPVYGQGVRVFVKDSKWRSQFGPWINICEIAGVHSPWPRIAMTASATIGNNSFMDEGFDPHDIIIVGIQVANVSTMACEETFYVDSVSFTTNPRPVPLVHTIFTFDELTPELQRTKPFGPHRPYWSDDPQWNAAAWDTDDISIVQIQDGKALEVAADFNLNPSDIQDVYYPRRKGFIRADFFPNLDLAVTDTRVLRAEIKFDPYVPPKTLVASWFLFDRRSSTEWIRGMDKPVGGSEWNILSIDLANPQHIHPSTTWPTDDEHMSEILYTGIQIYANYPYQGTIYIDNITIGGEIQPAIELRPMEIVRRAGRFFMLGGNEYFFSGVNNYYLFYKSHYMIDDLFSTLERNGIEVARTWGFCDGLGRYVNDGDGVANGNEGCTFQPWLGSYDQLTLENFDYVVYSARQHNVRLIIPLVNYWSDVDKVNDADNPTSGLNAYGGMAQYMEWFGIMPDSSDYRLLDLPDPDHPWIHFELDHAFKLPFYTNEDVNNAYKHYVQTLLNRTNIYTGVRYGDEPAIFAWELANEPRGIGDSTGNVLHDWIAEMTTFIKGPSCNAKQLVSIGDEGFLMDDSNAGDDFYNGSQGVDWERNLKIQTVDFGTARLYPDDWKRDEAWERAWILRHIEIAKDVGKPLVIEEYGLRSSHVDRVDRYREWMSWFESDLSTGVNGDLLWMVAGRVNNSEEGGEECGSGNGYYYPDLDHFTIWECSPEFEVLRQHAEAMRNKRPTSTTDIWSLY